MILELRRKQENGLLKNKYSFSDCFFF